VQEVEEKAKSKTKQTLQARRGKETSTTNYPCA